MICNEKGWFVAQSIEEMTAIGAVLGADEKIILGTAGIGDLIATGYSQYSRNRKAGDEIVATGTCAIPGEGMLSLPPLMERLGEKADAFPLLNIVKNICVDHALAQPALSAFFEGR